jgi:hypothetical protein
VTNEWGDIPLQIFQRVLPEGRKVYPMDSLMLRVFLQLDGRRDLDDIARGLGMELSALFAAISRLGAFGLIEPVQVEVERLGEGFFDDLRRRLSLEVGPVAHIMIEQTLEGLGYLASGFPARKAPELIDRLALEIPGDVARRRFREWAMGRIGRAAP